MMVDKTPFECEWLNQLLLLLMINCFNISIKSDKIRKAIDVSSALKDKKRLEFIKLLLNPIQI